MTPSGKHAPSLRFFALGFAVTAACVLLTAFWYDVANDVLGLGVVFDTRPAWLRALMVALEWLPWAGLALLVIVHVAGRRNVRPIAYGAGAISVWVALVVYVFAQPAVAEMWYERPFDIAGWRENERAVPMWPARLRMVDDLLSKHELVGLTTDSVERVLGPRERTTALFDDWDYVYRLGPERGLVRIDSEWLVLRVGADGRISERRIVRD